MKPYFTEFLFEQKTILVTGASSGIGKQVAIEVARLGAKVVVCGRSQERLTETLEMLTGEGHLSLCADLNERVELLPLIAALPPLDGVVYAAGILKITPFKILTDSELEDIHRTNFLAPVNFIQQLLWADKINKAASVVFISSVNGVNIHVKGFGAYASSKAALTAGMKILALEYAGKKMRFNAVAPGMIKTEMYLQLCKTLSPETIAADKKNYPLGDYGEPGDVANACIFLLSDASKWMTGTSMILDGGLTIS